MKIVTTHRNADFDALASVMAVKLLLPDAIPILPKQLNPNVKAFLSIHKDVFSTYTFNDVDLNLVAHLVVVDLNLVSIHSSVVVTLSTSTLGNC